jgi:hypothetical protein
MASDQFPPLSDDPNNPYAAPRAEVGPERVLSHLSPARPLLGDIFGRTWEIYKERMWICIAAVLVCFALNIAVSMLANLVQGAAGMTPLQPGARPMPPNAGVVLLSVLIALASMVFQVWINIGQALFMLHVGRGRQATFNLIFAGAPYILRIIGASLLFTLMVAGVVLIGLIPGGIAWAIAGRNSPVGPIVLALFGIAAVIAAIVIGIRLSQFYYLIVDRNVGVMDALRISLDVTKGNEGLIFLVGVLTLPINLLGLLACGVGLLFTIPFTVLLMVVMYLAVTGQSAAGGKGEPLAELEPI